MRETFQEQSHLYTLRQQLDKIKPAGFYLPRANGPFNALLLQKKDTQDLHGHNCDFRKTLCEGL